MSDVDKIFRKISPYYKSKQEKELAQFPPYEKEEKADKIELSEESHQLVYDSTTETLEPVYFWLLDFMAQYGLKSEKLIDNFTSSPGSGHFSELMGKATRMQEEAMKIMAQTNAIVKSIINIIYDLREFQIRLKQYKDLESKDKNVHEAAKLSLKQLWMDQVDIKRGNTSIKGMVSQFQYVTLIDAFMVANSLEDIKKMDLNDRVKRILESRLSEYLEWEKRSGKELTKRYNIEKSYLKSQVNSLKMYTRWAKPYLKAATQLEQRETSSPELVTSFNTIILQLTILARREIDFAQAITDKELPFSFRNTRLKRKYYGFTLLDFKFRGIPQRVGQHYAFGGKATVDFSSYALNQEEYEKFKKELEDSDVNDALKLVQGMTEESLGELKEDIEEFLEESEQEHEKEKQKQEEIDPFTALFKGNKKPEQETEEKKTGKIKPDNYVESTVRQLAVKTAKRDCFKVFDVYKKSHNMPSHRDPYAEIFIPTED